MGITERREREREEVRRKILDAARDLFSSEGYERVTMRRIAEAIEYSRTAIYLYFEDKDDLVRALCEEDFSRLLQALSAQPAPADPVEHIRALGAAYVQFGLRYPNHYRFMFMTGSKPAKDAGMVSGDGSFGLLLDAVTRAVAAGRLRPGDPVLYAQVLWSALHGAIALLITLRPDQWPRSAPPDARLVETVSETTLRGLLANPDGR
jgi:AcrR family transcriptional regulator